MSRTLETKIHVRKYLKQGCQQIKQRNGHCEEPAQHSGYPLASDKIRDAFI